jgi:DNA polymerase III epsilon subunit-like protein
MGWVILVVLAIALIYFVVRGNGKAEEPRPSKNAPQRAPNRPRAQTSRPPTRTRERASSTRSPERWNSAGREIPFAEPGLKGPLFHYGGTSVRGGVEHAGPYAVMDFETTGLSPRSDRVVEVAIARVDARGQIEDEFATLINPDGRDVGPTFIHGITNAQVRRAPTFAEVAPELLARMSGAVVVAHNATFEEAFLAAELKRAGIKVSSIPALCTLWLGRRTFATPNYKLGTLARAGGVALVDKHAALGDVRAVSALLPQMTGNLPSPLLYCGSPMTWTAASPTGVSLPLVTRAVALRKGTDGWMQSLVARLPGTALAPEDAAAETYLDTLAEVLSDGRLSRDEAGLLADLAGSAGMGGTQVLALNQRFLDGLKAAALEDDVLTLTEIRQLRAAAKALSLPDYFGDLQATSLHGTAPELPEPVAEGTTRNSMEARAERGRQALTMQRTGSNRAEIAGTLGIGLETVKALLRDAKFYENPESDPSRIALAREARRARDAGVTRDRFQGDRGIAPGKSTEAWRDSAMLANRL